MFESMVARSYEAMNRKDLGAMMRYWADDGVLEFGGRTALSGRYEGKAAIRGVFRKIFDGLAEIELTVRHVGFSNPLGLNYRNTMFVQYHVHERNLQGTVIDTDAIAMFEFRHGKLVRLREFWFDPEALEVTWGHAQPTEAASQVGSSEPVPVS